MVQGGMSLVKYLLFGFNFIFVISGIVLIAIGAVATQEVSQYNVLLGNMTISAAVLVIIAGVFVFLIAFFGCCGAIKENHCMTLTFSVLLFIILVLEFAAIILAYTFRDKVEENVNKFFKSTMSKYNETDGIVKNAWDDLQHSLKCCGVNSSSDWTDVPGFLDAPDSCCTEDVEKGKRCPAGHFFEEGCWGKLEGKLKKHATAIGVSGIVFLFIQVLGIVCACCLANAIKKQYEVV